MKFKTYQEFFNYPTKCIKPVFTDVSAEEVYQHIKARLQDEVLSMVLEGLDAAGFEIKKKGEGQ